MTIKMKLSSPVLFDTVILIFSCRNNLINEWIQYFDQPLIHKEVYNEIIDSQTKMIIDELIRKKRFQLVEETSYEEMDLSEQALFNSCKRELHDRFDLRNKNDLGEYKTLLYSKLYNVPMISTQDTTVWSLYFNSINFKGSKFMTLQDISYLMHHNGMAKAGRAIYKRITNTHKYPRTEFHIYANSKNTTIDFQPRFLAYKFMKDNI